jgi:osomolarity two-component system response regulator SKN7
MSVISEQLTAQAQQVQHLQELYAEVSQTNKVLVNEVLTLNKMLHAQRQAQYEMLNHLTPFNNDNRNNGMMGQSLNGPGSASESDDPPELRRARELLSSVSTDSIADRELERLHGVYASPTDSSAMIPPSMPLMHDPMSDLNRYPVYPVGQTVGIDPFHSDHIHKIPYSLPQEAGGALLAEAPVSQPLVNPTTPTTAAQMSKPDSMWGPKKPNVFLVEDDPTCAKIGIKFLKSMGCEVEHAVRLPSLVLHVVPHVCES